MKTVLNSNNIKLKSRLLIRRTLTLLSGKKLHTKIIIINNIYLNKTGEGGCQHLVILENYSHISSVEARQVCIRRPSIDSAASVRNKYLEIEN